MRPAFILFAVVLAVGCVEGQKPNPIERTKSLYTRLGGEAKIAQIVERFAEQPAVREKFAGPEGAALRKKLTRQLIAALGGPSTDKPEDFRATLRELLPAKADNSQPPAEEAFFSALDLPSITDESRRKRQTLLATSRA